MIGQTIEATDQRQEAQSRKGVKLTGRTGTRGCIEGNSARLYPLQYSGLENSMNCTVNGVAKSWTRLSDFHIEVGNISHLNYTQEFPGFYGSTLASIASTFNHYQSGRN